MTSADYAVQIKLIIMYTIGILTLILLFFYLHHINQRWLNKFSIPLIAIIAIMTTILIIVIKLP